MQARGAGGFACVPAHLPRAPVGNLDPFHPAWQVVRRLTADWPASFASLKRALVEAQVPFYELWMPEPSLPSQAQALAAAAGNVEVYVGLTTQRFG